MDDHDFFHLCAYVNSMNFRQTKKQAGGWWLALSRKRWNYEVTAAPAMEESAAGWFKHQLEMLRRMSLAMTSIRTPARILCCCR